MAELKDQDQVDDYVWIFGLEGDDKGTTDRSRFFRRDEARLGRGRVPAEQLQANIEAFIRSMGRAIAGVPDTLSGYSIDSIEISAEVSISGKVSLLGTGGEVAGKGGITFKLTRAKAGAVSTENGTSVS
jgi:hypothetical protein